VLPDFEECQKCTESGLTTQQWADLRVEGLQRPEVQQRLYRYRVQRTEVQQRLCRLVQRPEVQQRLYRYRVEGCQRFSRGSTGNGWRDARGQRFSRSSTGTGSRDSSGQRFSRGSTV
jgi:hypothetical protein